MNPVRICIHIFNEDRVPKNSAANFSRGRVIGHDVSRMKVFTVPSAIHYFHHLVATTYSPYIYIQRPTHYPVPFEALAAGDAARYSKQRTPCLLIYFTSGPLPRPYCERLEHATEADSTVSTTGVAILMMAHVPEESMEAAQRGLREPLHASVVRSMCFLSAPLSALTPQQPVVPHSRYISSLRCVLTKIETSHASLLQATVPSTFAPVTRLQSNENGGQPRFNFTSSSLHGPVTISNVSGLRGCVGSSETVKTCSSITPTISE